VRQARGQRAIAQCLLKIEHLERRAHADALGMRAARERPLPRRGRLRLNRKHPAANLVDISGLGRAHPLEI
jgi:hypothetical protein